MHTRPSWLDIVLINAPLVTSIDNITACTATVESDVSIRLLVLSRYSIIIDCRCTRRGFSVRFEMHQGWGKQHWNGSGSGAASS